MLLNLISRYLADVETAVHNLKDAYVEHYEEEILTTNRVNLRIRVRFLSGYLLELNEAIIIETGVIRHLGYRYHFQDKQNKLIFRYDNTPHYPEIKSFPHHKHLHDKVVATNEEPSILKTIEEVKQILQ